MITYPDIVAALGQRFKAVVPIIPVVLDYEPTALVDFPTIYTLLEGVDIAPTAGGVQARTYRLLHRLCVRWIDNEEAEKELMPYVDAIPNAILKDPSLGGLITSGIAQLTRGDGVFVLIGGALYRAIDFHSEILIKGERMNSR